jgi:TRAP-type mannitol/chloroaromatic compound transport system permease large subunit
MKLKKAIGVSDFQEALFFLIIFTLILGIELGSLNDNLSRHGSIVLSKPILFGDSIFETMANFCLLIIPVVVFLTGLSKKTGYIENCLSVWNDSFNTINFRYK